jgi:ABC-type sugar transport system substrate-binding protein
MKKVISIIVCLMFVMVLMSGCGQQAAAPAATAAPAVTTAAPAPATTAAATEAPKKAMKIAYFVSDMRETFHQAQFAEAQKYAKEKYGADVIAFDGKGDSNTMTANIDQIVAQGMDMATLHIWDNDAALPGIQAALGKKVIMASFFSPVTKAGIPEVRNDEAGVSEQMGKEMAEQWKAANPKKPIVMVELGWPNNEDVKSGRTDPFVKGVLSVDPSAKNLGCLDSSAGSDTAKQIIKDMCTQHPEVNLIYAESGGLAVGVMAALNEAGRGKVNKDGKPTTELVCGCDFDEVQLKEMFDSDSSLKESLALPPIETGDARIDNLFDIASGKIAPTSNPVTVSLAKAFFMSYYSTKRADDVAWLNKEFGTSVK